MRKWIGSLAITAAALGSAGSAETLQQIASNGVYAPLRPHGSGVYAAAAGGSGKIFVTWAGPKMSVYARAFDLSTNQWEAPLLIKSNPYSDGEAYHNYPVIAQAPDGRLVIVYFDHNLGAFQQRSPNPDSIGGTWTGSKILPDSEAVGYPTLVTAGSEMYLFYRHTNANVYRTMRFVKSSDNGASWSTPKTIIDTGNAQSDNLDEVYPDEVGYEAPRGSIPGRIRITWHLAGGATHNATSKNAYFAYLYTGDQTMRNAQGTSLGPVIDASDFANQSSNYILVQSILPTSVDKPVDAHIISRPNFNNNSNPIVGFNIDTASGANAYTAVWTGTGWNVRRMRQDGVDISGRLMDFQFVNNTTLRAMMASGLGVKGKETTDFGGNWAHKWQFDLTSQPLNGATTIGYLNTVEIPGRKVQALIGTFNNATRDTDYTGKWPVFAVMD